MYAIVEFVNINSAVVIPTNWFYEKKKRDAIGQKNLGTLPRETKLLKKGGLYI